MSYALFPHIPWMAFSLVRRPQVAKAFAEKFNTCHLFQRVFEVNPNLIGWTVSNGRWLNEYELAKGVLSNLGGS